MAETTAEVRRDIELTRERMSETIEALERKVNVAQLVRDHPWPALGLALGAGFLLAKSNADVKAAAATVAATGGASSKVGGLLDDLAARLIAGVSQAFNERVDGWVGELKGAIGAPAGSRSGVTASRAEPVRGDGQKVGFDESVRRSDSGPLLGSDQPGRESAALSSSSLAH
ncbi:MAG TPA: DUF3618 domain-containing protein [Gemmatimonadaceae bacterium]|nr:DUF3618 domain-containing protein [Gemmatimonadaceae bacterium]